jgi:hypothetical protein
LIELILENKTIKNNDIDTTKSMGLSAKREVKNQNDGTQNQLTYV